MAIDFDVAQCEAIGKLKSGAILCGGVGSGKSRTALGYFVIKECKGHIEINGRGSYVPMKEPKDLYIITTARKRDTLEWESECPRFLLSTNKGVSKCNVIIDSWNNIKKYSKVKDSFFIFDEQRLVGSGTWVKAFLKIVKSNNWILLSATPGDTWLEYVPVFIANGFYKNRTEFLMKHAVYSHFSKYPKIDHYVDCGQLIKLRHQIMVPLPYIKTTTSHEKVIITDFDKALVKQVSEKRWNPYKNEPIKDISGVCYLLRKVVSSDPSRALAIKTILKKHKKIIVFYMFDYELEILKIIGKELGLLTSEWNGHHHEPTPISDEWMYLVQYAAGAEGWNCIETNVIVFYSQNYSYKATIQAAGRIDRRNTPYTDLYYYKLRSHSLIDFKIQKAFKDKKDFNESSFMVF